MATTKVPAEFLADNTISGTIIADNAVTAVHIATNAISGTLIADNAVTTVHIAENNVTGTSIVQNAVTATQIATNAINTLQIADVQVTSAKIANNAILTQHIDDNQVDSDQLADNCVTAAQIADGSITATQLGANSVTLAKMASLTRGSVLIGNSSADVTALGVGSNGQVLKSDGTDIALGTDSGGAALTGSLAKILIDPAYLAAGWLAAPTKIAAMTGVGGRLARGGFEASKWGTVTGASTALHQEVDEGQINPTEVALNTLMGAGIAGPLGMLGRDKLPIKKPTTETAEAAAKPTQRGRRRSWGPPTPLR